MYWHNDFFAVNKNLLLLLSGLSEKEKAYCGLSASYKSINYSSSITKQMLLYISVARKGGKAYIDLETLADEMGCTIVTLRKNNSTFQRAGILQLTRWGSGGVIVRFNDFSENVVNMVSNNNSFDNHEFGIENKDYIFMSTNKVREIVKLENLHAIRIALHFQILESEAVSNNSKSIYLSYEEIKQFVPVSAQNRKHLKKVIKEVKKVFNVTLYDTKDKLVEFLQSEEMSLENDDKLDGLFLVRIDVQKVAPYKIRLHHIPALSEDDKGGLLVLDEVFWKETEYLQFYPEYLLITKMDKSIVKYVHEKYLENVLENNSNPSLPREVFWSQVWLQNCEYKLPEGNGAALKYLWDESKKRNKWKQIEQ